jgi:hypothetical protein
MKPPAAGCWTGVGVVCLRVWLGWAGWLEVLEPVEEPVLDLLLLPPREEELREPALPLLEPLPARAQESSAVARANRPRKAKAARTATVLPKHEDVLMNRSSG